MSQQRSFDYAELKKNELAFQNEKHSKSSLQRESRKTTVEEFERRFLTPIHLGGYSRGLLCGLALQELLEHDIRGKRILDYCCGNGHLGVFLAMKGASVYGFDLSDKAIDWARSKAQANNVEVDFAAMDAEELRYPDSFFDFVIGWEALHHVILYPKAPVELARVTKSGGKIIFAENWGGDNPFFQLWRYVTILRRNRSSDRGEVILSQRMLGDKFRPYFQVEVQPLSLLYMSKKYLRNASLLKAFLRVDNVLLKAFPFLRNYCGEAVIELSRIAL